MTRGLRLIRNLLIVCAALLCLNAAVPEKAEAMSMIGGSASGPCGITDPTVAIDTWPCLIPEPLGPGIIAGTACLVRAILGQTMFKIYCHLRDEMEPVLRAMLVLWLIFFTICVIFGLADVKPRDTTVRVMKILIVYAFATQPDLFYNYFYRFWMDSLDGFSMFLYEMDFKNTDGEQLFKTDSGCGGWLGGFFARNYGIFCKVDKIFNQLVGRENLIGLGALGIAFLLSSTGFMVGFLIMSGVFAIFWGFIQLLRVYAVSIFALMFLLMWAPVFFSFLMFTKTRKMFNAWIASLITHTMMPVIVLLYLFVIANALDAGEFLSRVGGVWNDSNRASCQTAKENFINNPAVEADKNNNNCMTDMIDMRGRYELDLAWSKLKFVAPKFKDGAAAQAMTGEIGEDPTKFLQAKKTALAYIVAFIVLNSVTGSFLQKLPRVAMALSTFYEHPAMHVATIAAEQKGDRGWSSIFSTDPTKWTTAGGPGGMGKQVGTFLRDSGMFSTKGTTSSRPRGGPGGPSTGGTGKKKSRGT